MRCALWLAKSHDTIIVRYPLSFLVGRRVGPLELSDFGGMGWDGMEG